MTAATQYLEENDPLQMQDREEGGVIAITAPRVLVLWASTGNGHISVSRALETALCAREMEVLSVDALTYSPGGYRTWYGGGYEMLVRRWPWLWGLMYRVSDDIGVMYHLQTAMDTFFLSRLEQLIRSFRPDWVICTHSVPQPCLARIRARLDNFRIGVVVTDFYPHSMWRRGNPDRYFVASEWSRDQLDALLPGYDARISVTGIPTDPRFAHCMDRATARRKLDLDPELPTMMLTSGGIGGGPLLTAARSLAKLDQECQVVVVCGRSKSAYNCMTAHVSALNAGGRVRFRIEGYVDAETMATLMHASDLLIGKPGGATMAEALASGCPLMVYTPLMIPGQEQFNAELLLREGVARVARRPENLRKVIRELLATPERLETMRACAARIARPEAATEIARLLSVL